MHKTDYSKYIGYLGLALLVLNNQLLSWGVFEFRTIQIQGLCMLISSCYFVEAVKKDSKANKWTQYYYWTMQSIVIIQLLIK